MDVISSVAFGTQVDSQNNPDDPFVHHASKFFSFTFFKPVMIFFSRFNHHHIQNSMQAVFILVLLLYKGYHSLERASDGWYYETNFHYADIAISIFIIRAREKSAIVWLCRFPGFAVVAFPFLLKPLAGLLPNKSRDEMNSFFIKCIQKMIKQRDDLPPEQVWPWTNKLMNHSSVSTTHVHDLLFYSGGETSCSWCWMSGPAASICLWSTLMWSMTLMNRLAPNRGWTTDLETSPPSEPSRRGWWQRMRLSVSPLSSCWLATRRAATR